MRAFVFASVVAVVVVVVARATRVDFADNDDNYDFGAIPADVWHERKSVGRPLRCATEYFSRSAAYRAMQAQGIEPRGGGARGDDKLNSCQMAQCDVPEVRDATPTDHVVVVRTVFHIVNDALSHKDFGEVLNRTLVELLQHNLTLTVDDVRYDYVDLDGNGGRCLPAFKRERAWAKHMNALKKQLAVAPESTMNVYVTCVDADSDSGAIWGEASFPWDSWALSHRGGLWCNAEPMVHASDHTLIHEIGHCLGLLHVFDGPDYYGCKDRCSENVHARSEDTQAPSNEQGDLCSDTAAQPNTELCAQPSGTDCNGERWNADGPVDYDNYMGYAYLSTADKRVDCAHEFTPQQTRRMHCYLDAEIRGWRNSTFPTHADAERYVRSVAAGNYRVHSHEH